MITKRRCFEVTWSTWKKSTARSSKFTKRCVKQVVYNEARRRPKLKTAVDNFVRIWLSRVGSSVFGKGVGSIFPDLKKNQFCITTFVSCVTDGAKVRSSINGAQINWDWTILITFWRYSEDIATSSVFVGIHNQWKFHTRHKIWGCSKF